MKIKKSFRKSISLKIDKNGEIIINAPFFVSNNFIKNFVEKNAIWIEKEVNKKKKLKKVYKNGEKFLYFGEEFTLKVGKFERIFEFDGKNFFLDENFVKNGEKYFKRFYFEEIKKYVEKNIFLIAEKNNFKFESFKIGSAQSRWGSCSSNKKLTFSFRLAMTPKNFVNSVIVHELAHLKEMNHSKNFRNLVFEIMEKMEFGDYVKIKKMMKGKNGEFVF